MNIVSASYPTRKSVEKSAPTAVENSRSFRMTTIQCRGNEVVDWNDRENVRKLKELWADPSISTLEMERRTGVSKNALVAKAHRLNLESRESPIKQGGTQRRTAKKDRKVSLPTPASLQDSESHSDTEQSLSVSAQYLYVNMRRILDANTTVPPFMERPVRAFLETIAVRALTVSPSLAEIPSPMRTAILETVKLATLAVKTGQKTGDYKLPDLPPILCTGVALGRVQVS